MIVPKTSGTVSGHKFKLGWLVIDGFKALGFYRRLHSESLNRLFALNSYLH
jgi:hypothetical protein